MGWNPPFLFRYNAAFFYYTKWKNCFSLFSFILQHCFLSVTNIQEKFATKFKLFHILCTFSLCHIWYGVLLCCTDESKCEIEQDGLICDFCSSDQRICPWVKPPIQLPSDSMSSSTPLLLAISFPLPGGFLTCIS